MNTSITKLLFRLALPVLATNSANALTTYVKDTTPITESEYSEFVDRYGAVSVGESKLEWIDPQLAIHKGFLDDTGKCRFDEYYDVPTSALEQGRIVFVAEELAVDNLTCERVIQHGLIDLALQVNAQLLEHFFIGEEIDDVTPSPTASTSDAHLDPDEYPNYTQGGIYSYWTDGKSPWISWTTSEIVMNSVGVHLEAGWFDCDHWAVDDWHDENYMSPTGWQHLYTLEHRAGQFLSGYKMSGCADIWDPEPTDHHITYQLDGVKFYNEEKRDVSYEDIQAVILFDCSQGASITYENVFTTIHFDQATISAGASSWAEGVWTYCVEYFRKRTSIVYKGERPTFYPIAFD